MFVTRATLRHARFDAILMPYVTPARLREHAILLLIWRMLYARWYAASIDAATPLPLRDAT